ncbi:MAG: hypothetical protein ACLFP1_06220 [Candidatus Goldiibacteriota bacterium]
MHVRKIMVKDVSDYIKENFGDEAHNKWINSLSPEAAELFASGKFRETWYDSKKYYIEPVLKMCELFFGGDIAGARKSGRYFAKKWIRSPAGLLARLLPEQFAIKRFLMPLMSYYYKIVEIQSIEITKGKAAFCIIGIDETAGVVAERFAGGAQVYLRAKGYNKTTVDIEYPNQPHKLYTAFEIFWSKDGNG